MRTRPRAACWRAASIACVDWIIAGYHRSLEWVLRHERATLLTTAATLVITVGLYVVMPKGFLPPQDTGLVNAVMEAGPEVSFAEMQRLQGTVGHRPAHRSGRRGRRHRGRRQLDQPDAQLRPPQDRR